MTPAEFSEQWHRLAHAMRGQLAIIRLEATFAARNAPCAPSAGAIADAGKALTAMLQRADGMVAALTAGPPGGSAT